MKYIVHSACYNCDVAYKPSDATVYLSQTHLVGRSSSTPVLGQLKHGPVALAAGGTVKAVGPIIMDPLVVAEVPGQSEGLPAQVAHIALLTMDSHVVAKGHVVGVGFAAKVTPEFWRQEQWRLEVKMDYDTSGTDPLHLE